MDCFYFLAIVLKIITKYPTSGCHQFNKSSQHSYAFFFSCFICRGERMYELDILMYSGIRGDMRPEWGKRFSYIAGNHSKMGYEL